MSPQDYKTTLRRLLAIIPPAERAHAMGTFAQPSAPAQAVILHLAIEQMESTGKATGELLETAGKEALTSWGELTKKSVRNFSTAQKSLMDHAVKPIKASATEGVRKTPRSRPRHKKHPVESHMAA